MYRRIVTREHRDDTRTGPCGGRERILEHQGFSGESFQVWGGVSFISVYGHMIGAQAVDGDQQNVPLGIGVVAIRKDGLRKY